MVPLFRCYRFLIESDRTFCPMMADKQVSMHLFNGAFRQLLLGGSSFNKALQLKEVLVE